MMSTAVVKHQGGELFNVSMERFEGAYKLAHTLAASGMFPDAKTAERACVKVMAGMEMGIAPMAAMTGIHVIETGGRVSVTAGANLMAQCVKEHPYYDYKINEFTKQRCEIEFFGRIADRDSEFVSIGISDFDMDDAKAANVSMKDGSNWRKVPRNMLFARAMSNGFKWYCPDAIGGLRIYTPDEVGAPTNDEGDLDVSKAVFADAKIDTAPVAPEGDDRTVALKQEFEDLMNWAKTDGIIEPQVFDAAQEWKDAASLSALEKKVAEWEAKRKRWNDVNCAQLMEEVGGDADFCEVTLSYIQGDIAKSDYLATFNEMKAQIGGDDASDAGGDTSEAAPAESEPVVEGDSTEEDADSEGEPDEGDAGDGEGDPGGRTVSTEEKVEETQMMLDEKEDDTVIGESLMANIDALALIAGQATLMRMKIRTHWHKLDKSIPLQATSDFPYHDAPAAAVRESFSWLSGKVLGGE